MTSVTQPSVCTRLSPIRWAALLVSLGLTLLVGMPAQAFHFPWDQGHDTTDWNDPNDPGPCEGPNCDPCNSTSSPVYVPTGHFIWSDTDIALRGRPELGLRRTYNSYDARDGLFGNGWTVGCELALFRVVDSGEISYILRLPDGKRHTYRQDVDGSFIAPPGRFDTLEPRNDGTTWLTDLDGGRHIFDAAGRLSVRLDPDGNALRYSYDSGTNLLARMADDHGRYLDFTYNSGGRVAVVTDHSGRVWGYDYDLNGNLTSVTDPLGGVRRYQYSSYQPSGDGHTYYQLTRVTDESGVVATDVVYSGERVQSYTQRENRYTYSYNTSSKTVTKTDRLGSRWLYVYNDEGLIIQETDPLNHTVNRSYDANGREIQRVDELGKTWTATYDSLGRITNRANPLGEATAIQYSGTDPWPSGITSPSGRTTQLSYDNAGNILGVTDASGATSQFEYSAEGYPRRIVDALGNETAVETNAIGLTVRLTDPVGSVTEYLYDSVGNLIEGRNPNGDSIRTTYDALDRITAVIDGLGNSTLLTYDAADRVLSVTRPGGATTSYRYDAFGRVVERTAPDGDSHQYDYRQDNLLSQTTLPDGRIITYSYDANKRLVQANAAGEITTYGYTARGELSQASSPGGTMARAYDDAGRLAQETINQQAIAIVRNSEGERVRLSALGVDTDYTRDARGYITRIGSAEGNYDLSHDAKGRRIQLRLPNSAVVDYAYDAASRLVTLTHSGVFSANYDYVLDPVGRITQWTGNGADWNYQYDAKGRLIQADHGAEVFSYTYDDRDNRLDNGAVYDVADRLTEDNEHDYSYDLNGNLAQKQNKATGARTVYTWNARNQLLGVERYPDAAATTPTTVLAFAYGALGRRLSKTEDGQTVYYVYDRNDLIGVLDGNGAVLRTVTFGPRLDEPLGLSLPGGSRYYHADHQGSVIAISNTGGLVSQYSYGPYGVTDVTGDSSDPFRYTGREQDAADLYYYRSRYYDPTIGRFLAPDPLGLEGGGNLYAYANGDPINLSDPYGTSALAGALPIAGGAAASDGPIPIGDLIGIGILVGAGIYDLINMMSEQGDDSAAEPSDSGESATGEGDVCPVPIPNDPNQPPGEEWEWRGKGPPESGKGSWYNPNTGESLHPDLNHPEPIGPHWDYIDPAGKPWRVDPGSGSMTPK